RPRRGFRFLRRRRRNHLPSTRREIEFSFSYDVGWNTPGNYHGNADYIPRKCLARRRMGGRGLLRRGLAKSDRGHCSTDSRRPSTKNLHLLPDGVVARRKILLREVGSNPNFAGEDIGFSFADSQLTSRLAGGRNLLRLDTARRSEDR